MSSKGQMTRNTKKNKETFKKSTLRFLRKAFICLSFSAVEPGTTNEVLDILDILERANMSKMAFFHPSVSNSDPDHSEVEVVRYPRQV